MICCWYWVVLLILEMNQHNRTCIFAKTRQVEGTIRCPICHDITCHDKLLYLFDYCCHGAWNAFIIFDIFDRYRCFACRLMILSERDAKRKAFIEGAVHRWQPKSCTNGNTCTKGNSDWWWLYPALPLRHWLIFLCAECILIYSCRMHLVLQILSYTCATMMMELEH